MAEFTSRLFVLGSGFSASMGLPTLANLFTALMEQPERAGELDKEELLGALGVLYPHFKSKTSPPAYPPFEEFLSLIDSSKGFRCFTDNYWEDKYQSALRLLTDCLASLSEEAEECELLGKFVSLLKPGDVVVTFNWDNLIERKLHQQGKNISFVELSQDAVNVLKLHGSLNWVRIPEGYELKHPDSICLMADGIVRTLDFSYYDVWDVLNQPPLIVPPIATKRVLSEEFFASIWYAAFNALVTSKSLSFIGYSIPRDDLQARSILRVGVSARGSQRRRYVVIDPNPEVFGRYTSMIGETGEFHQGFFSEESLNVVFS